MGGPMGAVLFFLALVACPAVLLASEQQEAVVSEATANPIRKVVTMLQKMQSTIDAEGAKEKELFDKFMCYCKNGEGALTASINAANTKIPEVSSDIESGEGQKKQLQEDLKAHKTDLDEAKAAMASGAAIREKEAAAYATESSESKANLAAMTKATTAVENGMGSAFLQTGAAQVLKELAQKQDLDDEDREDIMAFLSQDSQYSPASGQIVGILKTMHDEMSSGLADAEAGEKAAIANYDDMTAAKTKEVEALTAAIEEKTARVGELAVDIVEMKTELEDTSEALTEDKTFLANLDKNCASKQKEWDARCKLRSEELLALADTIKILNDDDALELFKKTLPAASASLVQIKESAKNMQKRALALIKAARRPGQPGLDFIALAIQGKQGGMDQVVKMIDGMIENLKKEQVDDDHKKEYCTEQFEVMDDKKKGLEREVSDLETAITKEKDGIAQTTADIDTLEDSIRALDKQVAEATEQRKEEHEEFTELMSSNSAAKELVGFAKNRMNKFYNPKLYKAPPKRVLTEEERLTMASGGTLAPTETVLAQVRTHVQLIADPGAPPEVSFGGSKTAESGGVIGMMDNIIKDIDREMLEAETEEKDAQEDYEQLMSDSAQKRAEDSKSLTDSKATLANMKSDLEEHTEDKTATSKQLAATTKAIFTLHGECDWLIQYYVARKEARDSEIDAMGQAKAVLKGADFEELLQTELQTKVKPLLSRK